MNKTFDYNKKLRAYWDTLDREQKRAFGRQVRENCRCSFFMWQNWLYQRTPIMYAYTSLINDAAGHDIFN